MIAKFYLSKGEIKGMLTLETHVDNESMIMQLPKEKIAEVVEIVYTGLLEKKYRDIGILLMKGEGIEKRLYRGLNDEIIRRLAIRNSGGLN